MSVNAGELKQRVLLVVSRVMGVPVADLTEASSPDSIEHWDSLAHMKLVLALEEEFHVRFSEDQIMTMPSVGLIIARVNDIAR